jgi:hypothetical protein
MGSITRTINELLGLKPMNLEDALAGQVTGIFDTKTDKKPFVALPSDKRVFDPAKARIAKPKTKEEAAALLDMDDSPAIQKELEKEKANNSLTKPKDND